MHIFVLFNLNGEPGPAAVTGVEGQVTDLLLPFPGDVVHHRAADGRFFTGKVTHRMFSYELPDGQAIDGAVSVTLFLDRLPLH